MELRSKGWFMNSEWAIGLDTSSEVQVMKDMAMMKAFEIYQNWEMYKQGQRNEAILATMLSMLSEQHRGGATR
jgi:hypothetical protein